VEFGVLYKLRYPIRRRGEVEATQHLEVCTTRPETILGDTALAIHPDDARYSQFHQGWEAVNPLTGAGMAIVCDGAVDREFGTGVVKITPAHDHVDYQMSQRHNLRVISMLNTTGHVIGTNTPYDGLDRYEARARIVKELQTRDLLVSTASHAMRLARCSRSRDVLEPLLQVRTRVGNVARDTNASTQPQWYVRAAPLARIATHLSRTNQLKFVPAEFADDWYRWLGASSHGTLPN
jgi:valyl-tRNA synthetase